MTTEISIGLDLGSTYVKALAVGPDSAELREVRTPTPWTSGEHGTAQVDADVLLAEVLALLDRLVRALVDTGGEVTVTGLGVSGMAEAGVVVDAAGRSGHPVIAWFDPRGQAEIATAPEDLRAVFAEHTGLPLSPLATIAKLLHLQASGVPLAGSQWLNVPELVVHALGGDRATELSLASRTGLLDQTHGGPWDRALAALGVSESFLPPLRGAGERWGSVQATAANGAAVHPRLVGATLTVAGHDHLVASVAGGVLGSDQLYDSLGTAEALVRPLDAPVDPPTRARLADSGINAVRHVLPGKSVLLAGCKSGLLLRRVLQLLGVDDATGRDALDRRVTALGAPARGAVGAGLIVSGADNDDGVLTVRADTDGLSPEQLFAATLDHTTEAVLRLLDLMTAVVPPAQQTVVAGGWARMVCVRSARSAALPGVTYSPRSEDTAYGAAMFGAYAASDHVLPLETFARTFCLPPAPPNRQETHANAFHAADQPA